MPEITADMRQVLRDLNSVKNFGEFPKGRNYLYSRYKHEGYVFMGNKTKVKYGGKTTAYLTPESKVKLTKKGRNIVTVAKQHNQFMGEL
jgi:hypothetical protein